MSIMELEHWNRLAITDGDPDKLMERKSENRQSLSQRREKIYIGESFDQIYFTWRQSQCMLLFLDGKTQREVSIELGISLRTIERYTKDMCVKMNCRDKGHLIHVVADTKFRSNAAQVVHLN